MKKNEKSSIYANKNIISEFLTFRKKLQKLGYVCKYSVSESRDKTFLWHTINAKDTQTLMFNDLPD